jgi:hypothetical protein
MCKKDKPVEERIEGAETLAYLIEVNTELQQIASMSDHIISTLSDYFKYGGAGLNNNLQNGDTVVKKVSSPAYHLYCCYKLCSFSTFRSYFFNFILTCTGTIF